MLDPYNPEGSTRHVRFTTSKQIRWETDPELCHINWAVCDSGWEAEFCRIVEAHPRVRAYVKNHNLGLEIPYRYGSTTRRYWPDFIVLIDDDHGEDDPLHLLIEIKGYRREDAKIKKETTETCWIEAVNRLRTFGRWKFSEFTSLGTMDADFQAVAGRAFQQTIDSVLTA